MSKNDGEQKRHTKDKGRSLVEWITLGISIIILLVVAGLIVYQARTSEDRPTVIEVAPQFEELRQAQDHFYLPVSIRNSGSETAAGVVVQLRLDGESGESETASLTVDFLAGGATVEGVVVFRREPSPQNLSFVASYMPP